MEIAFITQKNINNTGNMQINFVIIRNFMNLHRHVCDVRLRKSRLWDSGTNQILVWIYLLRTTNRELQM